MSPAPQIAGRVTAMSEPASMAYPSVDLNLNYKLLNRGTEERGEEGEERQIYIGMRGQTWQDQSRVAQMASRRCCWCVLNTRGRL